MGVPTGEQFLRDVTRLRGDAIKLWEDARAEGDKKQTAACLKTLREIDGMVKKFGGKSIF